MHVDQYTRMSEVLTDLWQDFASQPGIQSTDLCTDGLLLLDDLCALTFSGPDVVNFLQGYLTCDVSTLAEPKVGASAQASALCNIQGRVVAHGWCISEGSEVITWIISASLADTVVNFMKPYLAFSRTRLEVNPTDRLILGYLGNRPEAGMVFTPDLEAGVEIGLLLIDGEDQFNQLTHHRLSNPDAWMRQLIEKKIVWLTDHSSAKFLPQMLGLVQLGAIDFAKGCYLGQEIVARAQHRGALKRSLVKLNWSGGAMPLAGSAITDESAKTIGTIIQAEASDSLQGLCLAVLQTKATTNLRQQDTRLSLHA